MENLSAHFNVAEFEHSQAAIRNGIPNEMNAEQKANAKHLCVEVLEKIRAFYNVPVFISSGFRSAAVNRKVGGAQDKQGRPRSQHCKGEAADFTVKGKTVEQVYQDIKAGKIPNLLYDQLINEYNENGRGWIHISRKRIGTNRKQNLRATIKNGVVAE